MPVILDDRHCYLRYPEIFLGGRCEINATMKKDESLLLTDDELAQTRLLGEHLARLRLARRVRVRQADAAVWAGKS